MPAQSSLTASRKPSPVQLLGQSNEFLLVFLLTHFLPLRCSPALASCLHPLWSTRWVSLQEMTGMELTSWLGTSRPMVGSLILGKCFSKILVPAGMLTWGCCWGAGSEIAPVGSSVKGQHGVQLRLPYVSVLLCPPSPVDGHLNPLCLLLGFSGAVLIFIRFRRYNAFLIENILEPL